MALNALTRNPFTSAGVHFREFLPHNANWQEYLETMREDGSWADNIMVHGMADALNSTISVVTSSEDWHNIHHAIQTISPRNAHGDPLLIGNVADVYFWSLQRK